MMSGGKKIKIVREPDPRIDGWMMTLVSYEDEPVLITEEKQNTGFLIVLASQLDVSTVDKGGLFKVVAKSTLSYHSHIEHSHQDSGSRKPEPTKKSLKKNSDEQFQAKGVQDRWSRSGPGSNQRGNRGLGVPRQNGRIYREREVKLWVVESRSCGQEGRKGGYLELPPYS
jgi:hypothetical protein